MKKKSLPLRAIQDEADDQIKEVFASGSYVCDEKEFYKLLNDTQNPHIIKSIIRSLGDWPPAYTWNILLGLAQRLFGAISYEHRYGHMREELGPVILEVFFKQFPEPSKLYPPIPLDALREGCSPLHLFARLTENDKRGSEQRIRKWLRELCQLLPLSKENILFRGTLALALVRNGCFEECIAHQLFEAIPYLEVLVLGEYQEVDGVTSIETSLRYQKQPIEALKANHNAHAWITILRLMAIKGDLIFSLTIDPTEGSTVNLKPALIFRNPPPILEKLR